MINQVLKVSAFATNGGSQALTPFVDCVINDGLLQPLPHVNQSLLQICYVTDLRLVISLLHCAPDQIFLWQITEDRTLNFS